jgi:anti-anti-sigma factor
MKTALEIKSVDANDKVVVLRVQGHLDAQSTPLLMKQAHVVRARGLHLVVNLSGVGFIASSGIGGLLALVGDFADLGLTVRFASLSQPVLSVIKLINLEGFLAIDATEAEALQRLAA